MRLYTPDSLLYPITVKKLLRRSGEEVELNAPLFVYEYESIVKQWDPDEREDKDVKRSWLAEFESELEGSLSVLEVKVGQVLTRRTLVADIEEACRHEVQFGGLCANCGLDVSDIHTYNETVSMTRRATKNTVHGRTDLLISDGEATRADEEAKRRLLDGKKLSLVVDLDQTVIHASVEPTIGEWQNDPNNPNHEALKDVRKFQLQEDPPGKRNWYYVKLRPGLQEFLSTICQYYEMHIYTMGTRPYASQIAAIIDPERKIFGDRILSRDESGSMQAKNLPRLFPVDTKMVVIIDDRADVWHWISNLIKVNLYDFFPGAGDLNSSFLPKRPELEAKPVKAAKMERTPSKDSNPEVSSDDAKSASSTAPSLASSTTTAPSTNGSTSAIDQLVSIAGKQDAESIKSKEEEQEQAIAAQLEDRPLLQKQKMLDALEEEEAKTSPAIDAAAELLAENGGKQEDIPAETKLKYRHNLLQDDDTELQFLTRHLQNIHGAFFEEYERHAAGAKGSRVAELRPGHTKKRSVDEQEHVPDAAAIMDDMKSKVLAGTHIVFSGVVPLGVDIHSHDTAIWAKSFGASVGDNVTKRTTHVIASPERRTAKVRQAAKKAGRIFIVGQSWLHACFREWRKVDEEPFRIHSEASANGAGGLPDSFADKDFTLSCSDEEPAQTEEEAESDTPNGARKGLSLDTEDLDTDDELAKIGPSLDRQDSSPTDGEAQDHWDGYDKELEDFMNDSEGEGPIDLAELDGDTDAEDTKSDWSDRSETSEVFKTPPSQRKRKQAEIESDDEEQSSRLQKRKKEALGRTTSLTNIAAAAAATAASASSTRAAVGDEEAGGRDADGEDGDGEEDDDLEAALAAEMALQSEEDEADAEAAEKAEP